MRASTMCAGGAALLLLAGCAAGPGNQRADPRGDDDRHPGGARPRRSGRQRHGRDQGRARATGQVCWNLYARGIDAGHRRPYPPRRRRHRRAAGAHPDHARRRRPQPGLRRPSTRAWPASSSLRAHDFYVNVHTAPHPAGAIRGQLRGGPANPRRIRERGRLNRDCRYLSDALGGACPGGGGALRARPGRASLRRFRAPAWRPALPSRPRRRLPRSPGGSGARLRRPRRGRPRRDRARRGRPCARLRRRGGGARAAAVEHRLGGQRSGRPGRDRAPRRDSVSFSAFFACLRTFFGTFTPPTRFGIFTLLMTASPRVLI